MAQGICSIDGCNDPQPRLFNGWCRRHYDSWRNYGDPLVAARIVGDDQARFWVKVDKTDTCWLWTATTNQKGYGRFWCGDRLVSAHRWSYEQHAGPVPEGRMVLHHCDNPPCVRPDHLFLGDAITNSGDMMIKGRFPSQWSSTSQFGGVSLRRQVVNGRTYEYWAANISINGVPTRLGQFASEREAAAAYDAAVVRHGLQRRVNLRPDR